MVYKYIWIDHYINWLGRYLCFHMIYIDSLNILWTSTILVQPPVVCRGSTTYLHQTNNHNLRNANAHPKIEMSFLHIEFKKLRIVNIILSWIFIFVLIHKPLNLFKVSSKTYLSLLPTRIQNAIYWNSVF